jgi:hypothetical protein
MLIAALLAAGGFAAPLDTPQVSVRAAPQRILVERGASSAPPSE